MDDQGERVAHLPGAGVVSHVPVVLRYFGVLGRAQAIRHSLIDAGVDFEDVRVTSDWSRLRDDPTFSGSYRALPTLTWGTLLVSEALPIASFVARRLGQHEVLGEDEVTRREAICSSCYLDVLLAFAGLIRADQIYPGADTAKALPAIASRILQKIEFLDRHIPDTGWIGGDRPVVADFFLGEAFEVLRYVLGPLREPALRSRFPRLAGLARAIGDRPRLAASKLRRPARFTGHPDEDRVIEDLRSVDLSPLAL